MHCIFVNILKNHSLQGYILTIFIQHIMIKKSPRYASLQPAMNKPSSRLHQGLAAQSATLMNGLQSQIA